MKPVLIIALQPTMDRTAIIPNFKAGKDYRIPEVTILPSGKAINVARSLHTLGVPVIVVGFLAGYTGAWIKSRLQALGIPVYGIEMRGENRVAYSIYDPEANQLTELIEDTDGPVDGSTLKALMEKIKELLDTISSIVLSGRAPVGFPENGYRLILEIANRKNLPVYLDCYGPLLQQAINSCPFLLKINRSEASNFLDQKLSPDGDLFEAGKKILSLGVRNVIITSGARGAVLVTREGEWLVEAPPLKGAAVGSGDAMLAGLISQISQGKTLSEALRFGAAVGSANVKIPGAGLFLVEDVHEIIKEVILSIHGPPTFLGEK